MAVINNDPKPVLRAELSRVFKNQRVIRAFEQIFDLIPPEFINQQVQIDTINLIAGLAEASSNEAASAIERLAGAVERLAAAPPIVPQLPVNDVRPRQEIGTMGEQQSDAVDIKAGTVVAALTDSTTNLIASSAALGNGAGAGAGTILNAPTAGNPTKWVPIDDNGTTRYIPTWT